MQARRAVGARPASPAWDACAAGAVTVRVARDQDTRDSYFDQLSVLQVLLIAELQHHEAVVVAEGDCI
jgi:hypothetical protein